MFEDSKVIDPAVLFPALAAAIDALTVRPDPATPAAVVRAQARALVVLTRRVQALLLGRLAVIDGQGLADGDGFGSTVAWVRAFTNVEPAGARGLVDAARLADRLPSLGAVAAAGKVAPEHLAAFAAVTRDVPAGVVAGHEFTVTNLAPHARPADLRRLGEKIRDCHDQAAATDNPAHLHERRQVNLVRTFQGGWDLHGSLDPEAGASVQVVLDALSVKLGPEDTRTAGQRRADALVQAAQLALRSPGLPDVAGDRPRVTFLVRTDSNTTDTAPGAGAEGGAAAGADGGTVAGTVRLDAALAGLVHRMFHHVDGAVTGQGPGGPLAGSRRPVAPPADGCSCHPEHHQRGADVVAGDGVRWWSASDLRLRGPAGDGDGGTGLLQRVAEPHPGRPVGRPAAPGPRFPIALPGPRPGGDRPRRPLRVPRL